MNCGRCKVEMEEGSASWSWEMGAQVVHQEWQCPSCGYRETELVHADASHEVIINTTPPESSEDSW